uniref:Glycosyltransferase 61 catalytic domain-containing protein n=1 Tax=Fagus sylvatica TaxID=28930 RepID=A0A2N9IL43_FAGSY
MGKGSSRLVLGATSVVSLLAIFLLYAAHFTSDISPFDSWKLHLSNWNGSLGRRKVDKGVEVVEPLEFMLRRLVRGEDRVQLETTGFSCHTDRHSEVCVTNKPVMLDNNALTAYIQSSQVQVKHMVQPYARKEDEMAMKQWLSSPLGGYTGNLFHAFNEVIIPLFITCYHFRSHLQFVITDFKPRWVKKYNKILTHLSNFEVINPAKDGSVHCFPGAVVGLKYHDNLALYPTEIPGGTFMNEDEIVDMMEELGFQVDVATPNRMSNLEKFAEELNSCSVMVGAHGAGLTNAVFLPAGAVMVQVIEPEESSLFKEYGPDHPVIVDPKSIFLKGYNVARATYIHGQNVKINLVRFRESLQKAMKFLGH